MQYTYNVGRARACINLLLLHHLLTLLHNTVQFMPHSAKNVLRVCLLAVDQEVVKEEELPLLSVAS